MRGAFARAWLPEVHVQIIRIKAGGPITVKVDVDGANVVWRSVYVTEDEKFVLKSHTADSREHALGSSDGLGAELHSWDVHLANPGDQAVAYRVRLSWRQEGEPLHTNEASGTLAPDTVYGVTGDVFFVQV